MLDLLLPSFGGSAESPVFRSFSSISQSPVPVHSAATHSHPAMTRTAASASLKRGHSTKHLATLAHRFCVDGHNAWITAASERKRISGPLGTILWSRVTDRVAHARYVAHKLWQMLFSARNFVSSCCSYPLSGDFRAFWLLADFLLI